MYYYKFNIQDYLSHTMHLSEMEDLAYRRLLDWYYLHERPIPKDIDLIAKHIRMRTHGDCIANVLREFFIETDNGFESNRANSEIITYNEKSEKASKSAKARWGKNKNKNKGLKKDANALRTECEGNAIHKTLNTKQKTLNTIPYQLFADSYNQNFADKSGNSHIAKLTDARKRLISKAWKFDTDNQNEKLRTDNLDYWQRYFTHCSTIQFFQADCPRSGDHATWNPDLEFIIREKTQTKVREGGYK